MKVLSQLGLLLLLFLLVQFGLASDFVTHYPDEQHYTNTGLDMALGQSWLLPQYPDGSLRLSKPPLTYWLVASSYGVFGISPWTGRLPFVLLSLATLVMVCLGTRLLLRSDKAALSAAAMLALVWPFFISAGMSQTEMPLVFFTTLSGLAAIFVTLSKREASQRTWCWIFWIALGLVGLTKGLWVVLWAATLLLWLLMSVRRKRRWRRFISIPAMALGFALSFAWLVMIYFQHNLEAGQFTSDQITDRISDWYHIFWRVPAMMVLPWFVFMPWSLPAVELFLRDRRWLRITLSGDQAATQLAWLSCLSVAVLGLGDNFSLRYVLPVLPWVAIALAGMYVRATRRTTEWSWRRMHWIMSFILLPVVALCLLAIWQLVGPVSAIVVGILWTTGWFYWLISSWHDRWLTQPIASAALVLSSLLVLVLVLRAVALPDQGRQIADAVREVAQPGDQVLIVGKSGLVAKTRVFLKPTVQVASTPQLPDHQLPFDCVVVEASQKPQPLWNRATAIQQASAGYQKLKPWPALKALMQGKLSGYLKAHQQTYNLYKMD